MLSILTFWALIHHNTFRRCSASLGEKERRILHFAWLPKLAKQACLVSFLAILLVTVYGSIRSTSLTDNITCCISTAHSVSMAFKSDGKLNCLLGESSTFVL